MKRAPVVVPPPSKEVRDQLRGVQQIHPTDTAIAAFPLPSWLGYGSPYPPLMLRKKPKIKPSMAPELVKALQDKDKPSCQQGGWNGEDWKDWNDSSDWSQHSTWNSWNSKEEWIQDERYQEKYMVEDSHTDTDATRKASFDEYEYIIEESETQEDHDESEVLQHHRGEAPVFHRAWKRRHPVKGRSGKASCKHAKARNAKPSRVEVGELRFSQLSVKKKFQCGRPVSQLVQKLLAGDVALSAPFLRLTVYEATDSDGVPILKCIDNRRLLALKEYAKRSGKEVMVNVEFFSQNTVKKVQRIVQNSDKTDGLEVRVRHGPTNNNRNRYRRRF